MKALAAALVAVAMMATPAVARYRITATEMVGNRITWEKEFYPKKALDKLPWPIGPWECTTQLSDESLDIHIFCNNKHGPTGFGASAGPDRPAALFMHDRRTTWLIAIDFPIKETKR